MLEREQKEVQSMMPTHTHFECIAWCMHHVWVCVCRAGRLLLFTFSDCSLSLCSIFVVVVACASENDLEQR